MKQKEESSSPTKFFSSHPGPSLLLEPWFRILMAVPQTEQTLSSSQHVSGPSLITALPPEQKGAQELDHPGLVWSGGATAPNVSRQAVPTLLPATGTKKSHQARTGGGRLTGNEPGQESRRSACLCSLTPKTKDKEAKKGQNAERHTHPHSHPRFCLRKRRPEPRVPCYVTSGECARD